MDAEDVRDGWICCEKALHLGKIGRSILRGLVHDAASVGDVQDPLGTMPVSAVDQQQHLTRRRNERRQHRLDRESARPLHRHGHVRGRRVHDGGQPLHHLAVDLHERGVARSPIVQHHRLDRPGGGQRPRGEKKGIACFRSGCDGGGCARHPGTFQSVRRPEANEAWISFKCYVPIDHIDNVNSWLAGFTMVSSHERRHSSARFHLVAEAGSFSAAARASGVGQPTLSAQVKALEATYGVALFNRRGRGVTPRRLAKICMRSRRVCSPRKKRPARCSPVRPLCCVDTCASPPTAPRTSCRSWRP